jgi:hypothetical protein
MPQPRIPDFGLLAGFDGGAVEGEMNRVGRERRAVFSHVVKHRGVAVANRAMVVDLSGLVRSSRRCSESSDRPLVVATIRRIFEPGIGVTLTCLDGYGSRWWRA